MLKSCFLNDFSIIACSSDQNLLKFRLIKNHKLVLNTLKYANANSYFQYSSVKNVLHAHDESLFEQPLKFYNKMRKPI